MAETADRKLRRIRHSMIAARSIIEQLYPVKSQREQVLKILAASIKQAHRFGRASWEVTLFPDYIRLNVGIQLVLQLEKNVIRFAPSAEILRAIPKQKRQMFKKKYGFVPHDGYLPVDSLSAYQNLSAAHVDQIERAAKRRSTSWWPHAHSPSVIAVLREHGYQLPNPTQAATGQPASNRGRTVLEDLDLLESVRMEGRKKLRQHLVAERNPALVRNKKKSVLKATGRLACEICTFDFEKIYGSVGENFAEAHHTVPLADFVRARKVHLKELAIVCSNCHRMLHNANPVLALAELRKRLKRARGGRSSS